MKKNDQESDRIVALTVPTKMDLASATRTNTKQYDFARNWRKKIVPLLNDSFIVQSLSLGLKLYDSNYKDGDPPCRCGRGSMNGQRVREGCLSWYQPWGRCHHIAPFCWAIGKRLYPELQWGFVSGEYHSVVIGYLSDWHNPVWVMDILYCKERSAEESLESAQFKDPTFYGTLGRYIASFFSEPEVAYESMLNIIDRKDQASLPS